MAKISVVIPTYNYAQFLDEAITSVLAQTLTDFELIVVDNHSTDNTVEVVSKYLSDPRVSLQVNPRNIGLVGNWNECLKQGTAEYIKLLCADDRLHPQMLEKSCAVLDELPTVSLVTCEKRVFDGLEGYVELPLKGLQPGWDVIIHTLRNHWGGGWIGEPTSVTFRRSNLRLGSFSSDYILHVDWEMWLRHLTVGDCYIIPEALAEVRAHAAQHTKKVIGAARFEEYRMAKSLRKLPTRIPAAAAAAIDQLVKDKAAILTKQVLFKEMRLLHRTQNRQDFFVALGIALQERVFTDALGKKLRSALSR